MRLMESAKATAIETQVPLSVSTCPTRAFVFQTTFIKHEQAPEIHHRDSAEELKYRYNKMSLSFMTLTLVQITHETFSWNNFTM